MTLIFIFRAVLSLWFYITIGVILGFVSRKFFDPKFQFKKMLRLTGFALIWPIALFSAAGRKKIINILEE